MKKRKIRSMVVLVATDEQARMVDQSQLDYFEYYEEGVPLIDSEEVRAQKGIRHVYVLIFNSDGDLEQKTEVHYDANGEYINRRSVFSDGTVHAD